MQEKLISEHLVPVMSEADARPIVIGAPILPRRFLWRRVEYTVIEVLEEWKETGACHHGSGERYVRKHWYRLQMTTGEEMIIYFERQDRSKQRWWLYTVTSPG